MQFFLHLLISIPEDKGSGLEAHPDRFTISILILLYIIERQKGEQAGQKKNTIVHRLHTKHQIGKPCMKPVVINPSQVPDSKTMKYNSESTAPCTTGTMYRGITSSVHSILQKSNWKMCDTVVIKKGERWK